MGKMKALIDTNVLLDHLAKRDGFYQDAAIIFSLVNDGYMTGIISAISIVNCAYVLPKHYDGQAVLENIKLMLKMFTVANVDSMVLQDAAAISPNDYEDAVQYFSALKYNPDLIITRDKKGFQDFNIPVMTPADFVSKVIVK